MIVIRRNEAAVTTAAEDANKRLRASYIASINKRVGDVRSRFITISDGQEMIYQAKQREAFSFLSQPTDDLSGYPFLRAETGVLADTPYEVAQIWANMSVQWETVGAYLERLRGLFIKMIESETNADEMEAVLRGFDSQLHSFLSSI